MRILCFLLLFMPFQLMAEELSFEEARSIMEEHLSQIDGDWEGKIFSIALKDDRPDQLFEDHIRIRIRG